MSAKNISRRDFVKGTLMLGAAAAIGGITGCAAKADETTTAETTAAETTAAETQAPAAPVKKDLKVKVAVFSPTEGTKNAAAMLAAKFSRDVEFADITTKAAQAEEVSFADADLAIFAAPSYGGQIPKVEGLFENIKGDNTPCVVVAAFGNRAAENVYANLADVATRNGFVVVGAMGLVTPHVFSSNAKAGHSRPNVDDNLKMAEFADKLMEKLDAGTAEAITIEGVAEVDFAKEISVAPKAFLAENCKNCGACAANCPVGAINAETLEVDESICIACQRCSFVCEFNARTYDTAVKREFIEGKLSAKKPVEYFL